jgi:hypothetical protein
MRGIRRGIKGERIGVGGLWLINGRRLEVTKRNPGMGILSNQIWFRSPE